MTFLLLALYAAAASAAVISQEAEVVRERRAVINYEDYEPAHLSETVWSCDFEGGDVCARMMQVNEDNFDWTIGNTDTGKYAASAAGMGSYYAYFDTTQYHYPGDSAKLRMATLQRTGHHCLWFKAHMDGLGLDTARLRVYAFSGKHSFAPIYERSGSLGTDWVQQRIELELTDRTEIWFEGVYGSSRYHSVGLDDIRVTEGKCPNHEWSCDFEGRRIEECEGLQQATDDDFDWEITDASTSSSTGPESALSGGFYAFSDASDSLQIGDKARLVLNHGFTLGPRCLKFAFNLYGSTHTADSSLSVYRYRPGGDPELLWAAHGRHDNKWYQAYVDVDHTTFTQIYIEGVSGENYKSDMSIDYMFYDQGECPTPDFHCDFESGGYCEDMMASVYDSRGSSFDWLISNTTTPSSKTGPSGAAGGDFYAYMEASSASHGEYTYLVIVHPFKEGPYCLQFKYHMYGHGHLRVDNSESKLSIHTQVGGQISDDLWSMIDEQGNVWHDAMVTIIQKQGGQLIFKGTRGLNSASDIGIDDIMYTHGACPEPPTPEPGVTDDFYCGFEAQDTQCSQLRNVSSANRDWYTLWKNTPTGSTGPWVPYAGSLYTYLETSYGFTGLFSVLEIDNNFSAGARCLSFMYTMRGDEMGRLLIYQTKDGVKLYDPEWDLYGNQSIHWLEANIDITHKAGHKIWIMARRGTGSDSDIALDNISYKDGACTEEDGLALPDPEEMWYCGFDDLDDNECIGWEESLSDYYKYNWTIGSEKTPSSNTGAWAAVSKPNFAYLESSSGGAGKSLVSFVAQEFNAGERCLDFYYHMFGYQMGTLNVYLDIDGLLGSPIWTLSGDQGFYWKHAQLTVNHAANGMLVFEAVRGSGSRSDICIDNISYTRGACSA